MSREGLLRRQLGSFDTLAETVSAMSSLSAHHLQQVRAALPPAQAYQTELAQVLARSGQMAPLPAKPGPVLVFVMGSHLGLCGGYNGHVAEAAVSRRKALGVGPTVVVGRRQRAALARRGLIADAELPGISSLAGLCSLALALSQQALRAIAEARASSVELVAARFDGIGTESAETHMLLPLSLPPADGAAWGLRYAAPAHFVSEVSRELLYVRVLALLTEALSAEHAARLLATRAAGTWLDDRRLRLRRRIARMRQESGTQETLEVAAAARAQGA